MRLGVVTLIANTLQFSPACVNVSVLFLRSQTMLDIRQLLANVTCHIKFSNPSIVCICSSNGNPFFFCLKNYQTVCVCASHLKAFPSMYYIMQRRQTAITNRGICVSASQHGIFTHAPSASSITVKYGTEERPQQAYQCVGTRVKLHHGLSTHRQVSLPRVLPNHAVKFP